MSGSENDNPSWDPGQYLGFADERRRPALDLLNHIPALDAKHIADLGCGPGTLLPLLRNRWPEAGILGVDASPEMLKAARDAFPAADHPNTTWIEADIGTWCGDRPIDMIVSNAALHWIPDHAALLPRLMDQLRQGGTLAIQMPDTRHGLWRDDLRALAKEGRWKGWLAGFQTPASTESMADYHRILAPVATRLDIWSSEYLHDVKGPTAILEWTRGAGARPYLDRLPDGEKKGFLAAYGKRLAAAYPAGTDGRALFPFRRLFIVATRN